MAAGGSLITELDTTRVVSIPGDLGGLGSEVTGLQTETEISGESWGGQLRCTLLTAGFTRGGNSDFADTRSALRERSIDGLAARYDSTGRP